MSRSFRKNPIVCDNKRHSKKEQRTLANRIIRRTDLDEVSSGGHYKKFYPQWDICDYRHHCTINDWLENWGKHCTELEHGSGWEEWFFSRYGRTLQAAIANWKKQYYWK
jgi:hypothetical protein